MYAPKPRLTNTATARPLQFWQTVPRGRRRDQSGGDPSKDLAGLEHASSRHGLIPIYVVSGEDDMKMAESKI